MKLLAAEASQSPPSDDDTRRFTEGVAQRLGLASNFVQPAYEDPADRMIKEGDIPPNIDPSNPQIDEWYELGRKNGALGGKLVGAGGGGFLMFYAEDHRRLRAAMSRAGLEEVRFRFDFEGTKVLIG